MKLPAFQFYTGDWLKDPALSMCLPATRGIWIDAIASMHENGRSGTLSGTPCQLARVLRCDESALMAAIVDLRATGAATVTERHGVVTLINRRMERESKERESNRMRQSRHRGNGHVTDVSCKSPPVSSSSTAFSKHPPNPPPGGFPAKTRRSRNGDRGECRHDLVGLSEEDRAEHFKTCPHLKC